MQALFSSFYVNLNILVENLKTAENGGFKPFLGIISCVPFLQIGEIPIFPLYIVACFWMFCYQLPEYPQTFVQLLEKGPFSWGGLWRSCPIFHISTFLRPLFFPVFSFGAQIGASPAARLIPLQLVHFSSGKALGAFSQGLYVSFAP